MSKKIELSWGGGSFDVIFDLATGQFIPYFGTEEIHQKYGGRRTYVSNSGSSGAGFIFGTPAIRKLYTYRVDGAYIEAPSIYTHLEYNVPGMAWVVPIDYRNSIMPGDWPIVVIREGEITLLENGYLFINDFLSGKEADRVSEVKISYIKSTTSPEKKLFCWRVRHMYDRLPNNTKRVLQAMFLEDLSFKTDLAEQTNEFWGNLGLHDFGDGFLYKISQGICRDRYTRGELQDVGLFQRTVPSNVYIISPNLYLQDYNGFGNDYNAVGFFNFDNREYCYEKVIHADQVLKVFSGDYYELENELREHAHQKWENDLEMLVQEEAKEKLIAEFCESNPGMLISISDSMAAGNCEPGTRNFTDKYFEGKEEVSLSDLSKYQKLPNVGRVIWHLAKKTGALESLESEAMPMPSRFIENDLEEEALLVQEYLAQRGKAGGERNEG